MDDITGNSSSGFATTRRGTPAEADPTVTVALMPELQIAGDDRRKFIRPTFGHEAAVVIRPDGYVAWVGDLTQLGLADALTTWFGPPAAA
jgi:hypothetical protein